MDITQWKQQSSVILGIGEGNPFISSIVCRAFTISNSVLLHVARVRCGCVCFGFGQFYVQLCVSWLKLGRRLFHQLCDTSV